MTPLRFGTLWLWNFGIRFPFLRMRNGIKAPCKVQSLKGTCRIHAFKLKMAELL